MSTTAIGPSYVVNPLEYNSVSAHWTLYIVRFAEPASSYDSTSNGTGSRRNLRDKDPRTTNIIIQNDCINLSISASKDSYSKSLSATLKVTDTFYPYAVSNGDWIMAWVHNSRDEQDGLVQALEGISGGAAELNSWSSGLKFVGRVSGISFASTMSNGSNTVVQNINAASFTELAASFYYSFLGKSFLGSATNPSGVNEEQQAQSNAVNPDILGQRMLLKAGFSRFSEAFVNYYTQNNEGVLFSEKRTPDAVIELLFYLLLGTDAESNVANAVSSGNVRGSYTEAILVPGEVVQALQLSRSNKPKKLWEIYNLMMGLQEYRGDGAEKSGSVSDNKPWKRFWPTMTQPYPEIQGLYRSQYRCKGFVPLYPPTADNSTYWATLSQYTNDVCNEMYTALKCGPDGKLRPTLVVREIPLGTNLYDLLKLSEQERKQVIETVADAAAKGPNSDPEIANSVSKLRDQIRKNDEAASNIADTGKQAADSLTKLKEAATNGTADILPPGHNKRAMFRNLPRWVIPPQSVTSTSFSMNEADRVNFVQVWGSSSAASYIGANFDSTLLKSLQQSAGNFVADSTDILRHGIRANIVESQFDLPVANPQDKTGGYFTTMWARMRADWLFNGHLKLSGSISCFGIKEPICEGDNLVYGPYLFHVTAVNHTCALSAGSRSFTTQISVKNGMLLSSLDSDSRTMPAYAIHKGQNSFASLNNAYDGKLPLPGLTELQDNIRKDR
jgi:hypothetical protein